ncbi:MAG: methyltransferase domain-containing protein [Holosporaceae bacterium]|jgi:SAM-dependent methyltransferase|nr:methyltransferase domain-containing protein [Holosporaceae bacterium]
MKQINFDFLTEFYDSEASRRIAGEISSRVKRILRGKRVLTIGFCGDFLDSLEAGELYYALPRSHEVLHCPAVSPLKTIIFEDNVLPFASNSWDAVVLIHHMEFYGKNPAFLRELSRVLKNDGNLIVIAINKNSSNAFRKKNGAAGNIRLSPKDIVAAIMGASFDIRGIFGVNQRFSFWPYKFSYKLNRYNEILINCFPFFSDVVVLVAGKDGSIPEPMTALEKQYGMT